MVCAVLLCAWRSAAADLETATRAYHQGDYATAVKEFTALAEQGQADAQLILGKMYMLGQGVARDSDRATHWYRAAAEQGNVDAQFFLGAMYVIPQTNVAEGLTWLRRSAEQGMQDAQFLLGMAYMRGSKELPRDPVQGDVWLRLAAKQNSLKFYEDQLASEESHMTPDQLAKAKALVAQWKPTSTADGRKKQ
jgi:TPR repeat protein